MLESIVCFLVIVVAVLLAGLIWLAWSIYAELRRSAWRKNMGDEGDEYDDSYEDDYM